MSANIKSKKTSAHKSAAPTTANAIVPIDADLLKKINQTMTFEGITFDAFMKSAVHDYLGSGVPMRGFIPKDAMRLALENNEDPEDMVQQLVRRGIEALNADCERYNQKDEAEATVTITVDGALAKRLHAGARGMGMNASSFAHWCVCEGEICLRPEIELNGTGVLLVEVDVKAEKLASKAASAEGVSISSWIGTAIREKFKTVARI